MPLPAPTAAGFVATVAGLDPAVQHHLVDVSALTGSDRRVILDALAGTTDIRPLCEVPLAGWDRLTLAERVGVLLVLAEALAPQDPRTGGRR